MKYYYICIQSVNLMKIIYLKEYFFHIFNNIILLKTPNMMFCEKNIMMNKSLICLWFSNQNIIFFLKYGSISISHLPIMSRRFSIFTETRYIGYYNTLHICIDGITGLSVSIGLSLFKMMPFIISSIQNDVFIKMLPENSDSKKV